MEKTEIRRISSITVTLVNQCGLRFAKIAKGIMETNPRRFWYVVKGLRLVLELFELFERTYRLDYNDTIRSNRVNQRYVHPE